jgi:RNA polymerase sigma-70 factor (ECF subfamily)
MAQLQQGQTEALDELYGRYAKKLYAFCYHTAHPDNPQESEDLVQDVFVRVIKAAHTFDPTRASFRTWMFRIARNHCIDVARRRGKLRIVPLRSRADQGDHDEENPMLEDAIADKNENVEGTVVRTAVIEAVRQCIGELESESERQAILYYYLGGKVYREIGEVLGESLSMARNRVKSAQEKVRRCLERKGIRSAV